ncbi:hypothetical protein ANN_00541, partial [Periplaneta americana]
MTATGVAQSVKAHACRSEVALGRGFDPRLGCLPGWVFSEVFPNRKQHGFREGFSCDSQITSLVQDLAEEVDRGGRIDAVVIDFSKAFDLVPHDILIDKLSRLGIDKRVVLWIQEFLKGRTQRVRVGHEI